MPRRKSGSFAREIGVDPQYGSPLVQKLINVIMERGKKSVARRIVYDALDVLAKKNGGSRDKALFVFNKAFEQIVPFVEVRSRRVGGSVYQVPVEVPVRRRESLAFRWLVAAAQTRPDKTMGLRLGYELLDASESKGATIAKKRDVQRMAEANRAFSHYAW